MNRYIFYFIAFLLIGCDGDKNEDLQLTQMIQYHGLTGDPISDDKRQYRSIDSPKAELGKLLFFTKVLSGNKDTACASCHHPFIGGDDDLSMSIGVDPIVSNNIGVLRKNTNKEVLVPRNAPTTFNTSLWKKRLFHDGRVERLNSFDQLPAKISTPDEHFGDVDPSAISLLQAQAAFPVTSEHEMRSNYLEKSSNDKLRRGLIENIIGSINSDISKEPKWDTLFREVYKKPESPINKLITFKRIKDLLAEYQNSQVFIDTPWKKYVEGNSNAISSSAKRGALLFYKKYDEGGFSCVSCHKGDFFTDEEFHVLAVPQIGFGKELNGDDRGRYLRTGILDDRYAFRTPSLINVEATAPYGHNGAFDSLEAVIEHHLNPRKSINKYDFSLVTLGQKDIVVDIDNARVFTNKAFVALQSKVKGGFSPLREKNVTKKDISDLIAFLVSLTDPCIKSNKCMEKWVPKRDGLNPDGLILFAE